MTTALHSLRNEGPTNPSPNVYPRVIVPLTLEDNRYPSSVTMWYNNSSHSRRALETGPSLDQSIQKSQDSQQSSFSYSLSSPGARQVVQRYRPAYDSNGIKRHHTDVDNNINTQRILSALSQETKSIVVEPNISSRKNEAEFRQVTHHSLSQDIAPTFRPSPRHTAIQSSTFSTPVAAGITSGDPLAGGKFPPIMALSASPTYAPPIAPKHRAQPQQPTYITPPVAPNPSNPIYSPVVPQQQEEVCMECAMRDQEMADVDATSPGIWDRESDVLYDELKQRELEDEVSGSITDPSRPRAKGGRLTEQNLKLWLSINPREPASRQQTLHTYIKAQRALLEAEALARARAMQEAKQLDNKMRDTFSQLRRSAHDISSNITIADEMGGLRIKPPLSPVPAIADSRHAHSHSREVTLLENGMIVEHVDVRKEEREGRERKRREEKRARKLSRSSALDVTSIISVTSNGQLTDGGLGLKSYSRYSQSSSMRPNSVLTVPSDRPDLPRAYSQASFSDVASIGSGSPRRSRFFAIRSFNSGWKSRDSLAPSGVSGSMIDMHLALQHESDGYFVRPVELNTPRRSQIWPSMETEVLPVISSDKSEKKKNGLARIWQLVTGSGKNNLQENRDAWCSRDRVEDDLPLAPPPPLSYLVDRGNTEMLVANGRQASTPSLPSVTSNKLGTNTPSMSPPTAPSSALPSPVSSRPYGAEADNIEVRINFNGNFDDQELQRHEDTLGKSKPFGLRKVHPVTSEPDIRGQVINSNPLPAPRMLTNVASGPQPSLLQEKSLPPLPDETISHRNSATVAESKQQTMYFGDPRQIATSSLGSKYSHPNTAFRRNVDIRRQSFSGLSSRPNVQSMSVQANTVYDSHRPFGIRYDEFGSSRRSLGRIEHVNKCLALPTMPTHTSTTKRKSKFLLSLLGKKQIRNQQPIQDSTVDPLQHFPLMRHSASDGQEDLGINGYVASTSRHSTLSMGGPYPNHRASVTSRKALEDLVPQDSEFVAYRYPSNDQRLDLLR
ncbi:hypothetical protein AX17_005601 [Amanita inopinata Kibby_2008]|nr:hypothetical protein AX17_005601 [Amanita inopinata Kibby_2008]